MALSFAPVFIAFSAEFGSPTVLSKAFYSYYLIANELGAAGHFLEQHVALVTVDLGVVSTSRSGS